MIEAAIIAAGTIAYLMVARMLAGHVAYKSAVGHWRDEEGPKPCADCWAGGVLCGLLWPAVASAWLGWRVLLLIHRHAPRVGAERRALKQQDRRRLEALVRSHEQEDS